MAIRVLMLDLGDTLVHDTVVFPHVADALTALSKIEAARGEHLVTCLVSDFKTPTPPPTQTKIAAIFSEYVELLDQFGLRKFFEPVQDRVTLSAHAGVAKPDRRIFEKAIERLGVRAELGECLFITEDAAHLAACSALGMETLRFGSTEGFTDWAEAPLLVAAKISGLHSPNMATALGAWLHSVHGMQLMDVEASPSANIIRARVREVCALPSSELGGEKLHAELPVTIELRVSESGRVERMVQEGPSDEAMTDATHLIKTLRAHRQIAPEQGPMPAGTTHQFVTDAQDRKVVKRRRFSAV
jgi:beta-phosphoglucomutase-like phosphatase (HAD superfamily)